MAVIVRYIVVRNGEEKMTFATKKEADAYDKMLDIADNLFEFLDKSELKLPEEQMERISLLLAENRDVVMPILRGVSPRKQAPAKPKKSSEKSEDNADAGPSEAAPAPRRKPAKN
jgi:dsDNA-binding SOS-regulon protein